MIKKRLIISSVLSIFLVSILLIGSTYSIFTSQEIDETANVYKTGNLNVTYKVSSNTVHFTDPTPMTTEEADSVIPYRITVTNTGNVAYEFDVILMDTTASEENTIDYQYIMTKVGYLEPISLSNCTNNIIKENVIVPAGKSVDIDIRLWLDSTLPNTEMGNGFYAKLKIDGLAVYNDNKDIDNSSLSLRYMNTSSTNDFRNDAYRTYIKTASFVDYIDTSNVSVNAETNEKIMWDMSTSQDKSIIAWLEDNGELDENGNKLYDLYIGSKEKIYAKSLEKYFNSMSGLLSISFDSLNTSLTTNMLSMFEKCSSIENLDLSTFNTSNVTRMNNPGNFSSGGMFRNCYNLKYLDVSSFDTSKITLFSNMFNGCNSLVELDVSGWNTSNATEMGGMFAGCSSLSVLDVSNFDTSNVIEFSEAYGGMFQKCTSLVSLYLGRWDVSSTTRMERMFMECTSLISLDLNGWNTSNVTNMASMFTGCTSLIDLDLSDFNTSSVESMAHMFANCSSLTNLDVSSFDTSNVINMNRIFAGCPSLISLNIRGWNTSNVTNMASMFHSCCSLTNLELSNLDTSNVIEMSMMFYNCNKLSTKFTVMNNSTIYDRIFYNAATTEGAQIIVNYIGDDTTTTDINESTEALVDAMIATKSTNSNVVKGELVV